MTVPIAFQVAQGIGNNLSKSFADVKDSNAIDRILQESINGGPEELQNNIAKILSQVSPEKQGTAIQFLQNRFKYIEEKQQKERTRQAETAAGVTPGLHPTLQAQQLRNAQPFKPLGGLTAQATPPQVSEAIANVIQSNPTAKSDELALAFDQAQVPRAFSNSYIENRRRQDESVSATKRQQDSDVFKSDLSRAEKVKGAADEAGAIIPQKQTALNLLKDAIVSKNLGFFSRDNLAEITGIEGLRSKEGAIFKTAGKEYFLGNISRAGARPNQWIEQQISDMLTKIGRDTAANLSVARALQNELDIDKERVRLTEEISERLRDQGDYSERKLGSTLNKELINYTEEKQNEFFNDLRAIKAIDEKTPQKFRKVSSGTKVTPYMVDALLDMFNNDDVKALQEAKKLGYSV